MNPRSKILLSSLLAIFIVLGFALLISPPTQFGWYQQTIVGVGNKQIADILFLDSLTGIAVANQYPADSNYVMTTTNGGDSWSIIHRQYFPMQHLQFLSDNIGYSCAGYLYKTTNSGYNWTQVNTSGISAGGMYVIDENSIWLVDNNSLVGGIFHTSDGGASWVQQMNVGVANPDHIYMYNARIGFAGQAANAPRMYKTTNGGQNWFNLNDTGFTQIYFVDSLTGWRSMGDMKKTTDGGLSWVKQTLPSGGNISGFGITRFSAMNRDTIWGCGGYMFYPGQGQRAFLFRTTNGGLTWYFQVPDTSFQIPTLSYVTFADKMHGWAYNLSGRGIHTVTGGDTAFSLPVRQISSEVPEQSRLYQNYPNPFNPVTTIKYQISKNKYVRIKIYDILGKEIFTIVDQKQNPGTYEIQFQGNYISSGICFYALYLDNSLIETRKMILLK